MGQAEADKFIRFYMVPGLAHGGGNFNPIWENLAALDNWVRKGVYPTQVGISSLIGEGLDPSFSAGAWPGNES